MSNKALIIPSSISLLFLLACFVLYGSAGHDDSHITYWASYALNEFGEILNYNGERVEQSSTLLLTILISTVAFVLQSDVVITGYILTYLSGALALWLTWQLTRRLQFSLLASSLTLLILGSSPAFLLWNTSGMEGTLAAACLLAFVLQWGNVLNQKSTVHKKSFLLTTLATFSLITVRPEMIFLCVALVFLLFIYRCACQHGSRHPPAFLIFYSTLLLCISLLMTWRYFYFDAFMPLPVYSKISPINSEKLLFGLFYLLRYGTSNSIFIAGFFAALIYLIRLFIKKYNTGHVNYHSLLSTLIILAYTGFIWLSGGDWMQSGRFLVPILPLVTLQFFSISLLKNKLTLVFSLLVLLLNFSGNYYILKYESHGIPLWANYHISPSHQENYSIFEQWNQEHLRDMDVIDKLDKTINTLLRTKNKPTPVTLMSGQAGIVFFYTAKKHFGKVYFYDSHGLVERSLLSCSFINHIDRSSQGLYMNFDDFFSLQPGLHNKCNIPNPDILYGINDMSRQVAQRMEKQGYTLIHKEGGKMLNPHHFLPVNTLFPVNLILIENSLLEKNSNITFNHIRYHDKPLANRLN